MRDEVYVTGSLDVPNKGLNKVQKCVNYKRVTLKRTGGIDFGWRDCEDLGKEK